MVSTQPNPSGVISSWPAVEEEVWPASVAGVRLRRFPFPYRCALAICNDTDGMTREAFLDWHCFVNGNRPTAIGDGLGLEVGDSFWVWSDDGSLSLFHGRPHEKDLPPSPDTQTIVNFARAGLLDTLHGFGCWAEEYALPRDRAAYALEYLDCLDLNPRVWVNHGGGFFRYHNIAGPWSYYQQGDTPGRPSYCLDLLLNAGIRYFWSDGFYDVAKFGDHHRFASDASLRRALADYNFRRYFYRKIAPDDPRSVPVFPDLATEELSHWQQRIFNRTLIPVVAKDNSRVLFFKRYRGHEAPTVAALALQLSEDHLNQLERVEGVAIIYQHLGVWRALGRAKGGASQRRTRPPVLDVNAIWALRDLAERYRAGRILVATTLRLLDYLHLAHNLRFSVERWPDKTLIVIKGAESPVYGPLDLNPETLHGLSFVLPREIGEAAIALGPDRQSVRAYRTRTAEEGDVLFVPWRRLAFPG